MKKDIKIYIFLFLFVALQIFLKSRIRIFPDLIVITVVYAGIFYDLRNVLLISFVTGLLRGVFSPETMFIDFALFPVLGIISYGIGKLFNRNNPVGGVMISLIVVLFLIFFHTVFLNAFWQNNLSVSFVFKEQWRTVAVSAAAYPIVYFILNIFLKKRKDSSDGKRIFY